LSSKRRALKRVRRLAIKIFVVLDMSMGYVRSGFTVTVRNVLV
jgi:hypothetical protein